MTNYFSSLIRSALAGPFIGIVPRIHTFPPATFLPLRKVLRTFPAFLSPRVVLTAVRYRWFQSLRWDRRPSSARVTCAELCCFLFRCCSSAIVSPSLHVISRGEARRISAVAVFGGPLSFSGDEKLGCRDSAFLRMYAGYSILLPLRRQTVSCGER